MTSEGWLLVSTTLVGAGCLVVHAAVVWLSLRSPLEWKWRALSLVPPAAPAVAWAAGFRAAPISWAVLFVSYAVLRMFS